MKNNFDFERYESDIHLTGRICLSIGLVMLLGAPFLIAHLTGAEVMWSAFWPALLKVLIVYVPSCVV